MPFVVRQEQPCCLLKQGRISEVGILCIVIVETVGMHSVSPVDAISACVEAQCGRDKPGSGSPGDPRSLNVGELEV